MFLYELTTMFNICFFPWVIQEIGPRVDVIPAMLHLDMFFSPFFSVDAQKESRSLMKRAYLLYFVQNFTQIIALDWFDHMNRQTFAENSFSTVQFNFMTFATVKLYTTFEVSNDW